MLWVYLSIYACIMIVLWGFFLVAKVHFFKFKEYSKYIYPVTKIAMISLLSLTILGGVLIYYSVSNINSVKTIEETATNEVF